MSLSKPQFVIVTAIGSIVLIFILIFLRILPGMPNDRNNPAFVKETIKIWGVFDSDRKFSAIKDSFNRAYPNTSLNFRGFNDVGDYEETLIDALATGSGPDVFMVPNASLQKYANKIYPAPQSLLSLIRLRALFPEIVEKKFFRSGRVYALPVSIDTLALYYNKNVFNQIAVIDPPQTWSEIESLVPKLTSESSGLKTWPIALGAVNNVNNASNIVESLMIKEGNISEDKANLTYGSNAIEYYTSFARAGSPLYAWDETLPFSVDAFAQGRVAMILDYGASMKEIQRRSRDLNFRVAEYPKNKNPMPYGKMWGFAVSAQSRIPALAWDFIMRMTTNPDVAESYFLENGEPPALSSVIKKYLDDPDWGVFAKQALTAVSWRKIDDVRMDEALNNAIQSVLSGENARKALEAAEAEYGKISSRLNN